MTRQETLYNFTRLVFRKTRGVQMLAGILESSIFFACNPGVFYNSKHTLNSRGESSHES